MESRGVYFDGQSSAGHQVVLRVSAGQLILCGDQWALEYPLADIKLSAALGDVKRSIYLPDGGKCEIRNDEFGRVLQKQLGRGGFFAQVHRFESSLKLAALALLLTAACVWVFIRFGIPVLAERMARVIPPEVEISMGEQTMELLDNRMFKPSELPVLRQQQAQQLFQQILLGMAEDQRRYQLLFRNSKALGANAFALPGGTVVVTDAFINLVTEDEQLIAVLAHEIGHIRHRHSLRQVIQSFSAGLLVASLTGDVVSTSSMAAALPTMLVDAGYSRDMERQADDVAAVYMHQHNIPMHHFADILTALQVEAGGDDKHDEDDHTHGASALSYLSTHPATSERIERMQRYQGDR